MMLELDYCCLLCWFIMAISICCWLGCPPCPPWFIYCWGFMP